MSSTRAWGPSAWTFLFSVAYGFDVNHDHTSQTLKIRKYREFFHSIPDILPCIYCRQSARKSFKKRKIMNFISKYKKYPLLHYVYILKDDVNRKLIRQEKEMGSKTKHMKNCTKPSPPFAVVLKRILAMRAKDCSGSNGSCHIQKALRKQNASSKKS